MQSFKKVAGNDNRPVWPASENSSLESEPCNFDGSSVQQKMKQLGQSVKKMNEFIVRLNLAEIPSVPNIIYNFCGLQLNKTPTFKTVANLLDRRVKRMMKNRKFKKNWSEEDIQLLVWTTNHYAAYNFINKVQDVTIVCWDAIAELLGGTTGESCMFKVLSFKKIRLSKDSWSPQQSSILSEIVSNKIEIDWQQVSHQLFLKNTSNAKIFRNAKQCKQHWNCFLNPNLKKGPWSLEEDIILIEKMIKNCSGAKWIEIARFLGGRTQNAIKNRYNLLIERFGFAQQKETHRYQVKLLESLLQKLQTKKLTNSLLPAVQCTAQDIYVLKKEPQIQALQPIAQHQQPIKKEEPRIPQQHESTKEDPKSDKNISPSSIGSFQWPTVYPLFINQYGYCMIFQQYQS